MKAALSIQDSGYILPARTKLLNAAIELIWRASYEAVGVNDICRTAAVTKGCFYHYFDSKVQLFHEAGEHFWQQIEPGLNAIIHSHQTGTEKMAALINHSKHIQAKFSQGGNPVAGCPFLTTAAQIGHREPLAAEAGQRMTDRQVAMIAEVIRQLQREDKIDTTDNPLQLARLCHQYYLGLMQYARTFQSRPIVEADIYLGLVRLTGLDPSALESLCAAAD